MGEITYDVEHAHSKPARVIGPDIIFLPGKFAFGSSYPVGGEAFDVSSMFPKRRVLGVKFSNKNGLSFEYDDKKIKAYQPILEKIMVAASKTHTVTDQDTPDGNALYVNVDSEGKIYFECNMATDEEDKIIKFGTEEYEVVIKHVAAPEGTQVYFDENGTHPDRLLADLGYDLYVPTNSRSHFVKIKNDASAPSNGVTINYDDGSDQRLEAETDGNADADIDLAKNLLVNPVLEIPEGIDLSGITDVAFLAWGY